jgi:hypothetical protein
MQPGRPATTREDQIVSNQSIRPPRAAQAIAGAHRARMRAKFVGIVAGQLDEIAAGTVRVHTLPLTHHGRETRAVVLYSTSGVLRTTAEQRAAAFGLLSRAFPVADWLRPRTYDARTGDLRIDEPSVPTALGVDTATVALPTIAASIAEQDDADGFEDDEGLSGPCDCGEGAVHYTDAGCPFARRMAAEGDADAFRVCGCPTRFNRHAWGADEDHDGMTTDDLFTGAELAEMDRDAEYAMDAADEARWAAEEDDLR